MNRKLKSFIITLFVYIFIVIIFLFVKIHLRPAPERIIAISLIEGTLEHKGKGSRSVVKANLGIGEGEVPLPYPEGKPALPLPRKPVPPITSTETGNGKKPYSIMGELSKRRLIKFVKPAYPAGKIEQTLVSLKIVVDKDGNVIKINLIKTGGDAFDRNAIESVREWKFQPLPPNETKNEIGVVNIYFLLK